MSKTFFRRETYIAGICMAASLVLYYLGLHVFFVLSLLVANLLYWPVPKIIDTIIGRFFMSILVSMGLIQVAATLQFLIYPNGEFFLIACLIVLIELLLIEIAPKRSLIRPALFRSTDIGALLIVLAFLMPFSPILLGRSTFYRIAELGSIQAIDGTNHYASIAQMQQLQHFDYAPAYYYPKGFHLAIAFVEDGLIGKQVNLGWSGNALLYFMQYMLEGSLLSLSLGYLGLMTLESIRPSISGLRSTLLLAFGIAPVALLLYLLPFINEGFLNYYYVCATVIAGTLYLLAPSNDFQDIHYAIDGASRWVIVSYLVLIFGASVSWPLLIPPLILVGMVIILKDDLWSAGSLLSYLTYKNASILLLLLLQLLPIYFQLKYSGSDSSQGINLTGGYQAYHPLLLAVGIGLLVVYTASNKVGEHYKRRLLAILLPLTAFSGILICMQYIVVGEVRYYVIKSTTLLEMIVVVSALALIVCWLMTSGLFSKWQYAIFFPFITLTLIMLVISPLQNPLKDIRDITRDFSNDTKPAYFDHDVSIYTRLGRAGLIKHFNSMLIHYDPSLNRFYAHGQIPFWANMMQYDGSTADFNALMCEGNLYSNLDFTAFISSEQIAFVNKMKECIQAAIARGETYYIVTDSASALQVHSTFGHLVKVISQ